MTTWTLLLLLLLGQAHAAQTRPPASGRDASSAESILPADVLSRLELLSLEIDLIRRRLGRPRLKRHDVRIDGISPREVYFQARSLYRRTDRLSLEQIGSTVPAPPVVPVEKIRPQHVWQTVDASLARVLAVKENLGLKKKFREPHSPENTTPTDVYRRVVSVKQELESLMLKETEPADVYEEITRSVHLAAKLLALFPGKPRFSDAPAFEGGKKPADVYARLVRIAEKLQKLMVDAEVKNPAPAPRAPADEPRPVDVHTVAVHIVSQLATLHASVPGAKPPMPVYYAGEKTPSDVFRRAGLLERQIDALRQSVKENPAWMR